METTIFSMLLRLKSLAERFGHLWAVALTDEEFENLYKLFVEECHHAWHVDRRLSAFSEAVNNLAILRDHPNLPGGRLLKLENAELKYYFGSHDQLCVELSPSGHVSAEYTNSRGDKTILNYYPESGKYRWIRFPTQQRDAARVVAVAQFFTGQPVNLEDTPYNRWDGTKIYFKPDEEYQTYINHFASGRIGAFMAAPFQDQEDGEDEGDEFWHELAMLSLCCDEDEESCAGNR